jgi:hypothetical protein
MRIRQGSPEEEELARHILWQNNNFPPGRSFLQNKGMRIRQGSPEEEEQLARHILSLAPSPTLCSEVGLDWTNHCGVG